MHNSYDTDKSIMISAPAGSGKTERLARRYIDLLRSGVEVERILSITFTDKAAAEMKKRILNILKTEHPELFRVLLHKMPLMRVSTIHSFCGTLLRRFSFEASIDPNYRVEDAIDSSIAWEETLYQVMLDAGKGFKRHALLLDMLSDEGFRGLQHLRNAVDYLFLKKPFSVEAGVPAHLSDISVASVDTLKSWPVAASVIDGYDAYFHNRGSSFSRLPEQYFLTEKKLPRKKAPASLKRIPDYEEWARNMHRYWKDRSTAAHIDKSESIRTIFNACIDKYAGRKKQQGILDFGDLEYLAYKMLTANPEWANILYAFDEKTDHILVDEFQDTNSFQWELISKLTEEWRSGLGAKRAAGIAPTCFFVGDTKQSIYYFRGANVDIFAFAKEEMSRWLGNDFGFEEVRENFRSRSAIVDFANHLFARIMRAGEDSPPWVTRYSACSAQRDGTAGHVELILLDTEGQTANEAKKEEAEIIARRIRGLLHSFDIAPKGESRQRRCRYGDIAMLMRKRTHLQAYEEALRKYHIPFIAIKGIGFYQEPEVAMLRALVFFLSHPGDDYSLYVILKSPLFRFDEDLLLVIADRDGRSLYQKMQATGADDVDQVRQAVALLSGWFMKLCSMTVAELIEDILVATGAWTSFYEPQRRANIKKFIRIVEELEAQGKTIMKIRDFLERTGSRSEEPKANVNTEGMDAVKIMTIHAAKGLEFPVVILTGLEEPFYQATGDNLVYEQGGHFFFKSMPDSSIRREDTDFLIHRAKEEEEQKRIFYVAVTRAEEALFLFGRWDSRPNSFMGLLRSGLDIEKTESRYRAGGDIPGLSILNEKDVIRSSGPTDIKPAPAPAIKPIAATRCVLKKRPVWQGVTDADIQRRHGTDWLVLGDVLHRIFEGISNRTLTPDQIRARATHMLAAKGLRQDEIIDKLTVIEHQISILQASGTWQEIILPKEDAYAELPFVMNTGETIHSGRIDRIIKEESRYKIYDYKTFPVQEEEITYYLKGYAAQLTLYKAAVSRLFHTEDVSTSIVFTSTGQIEAVI